MTVSRPFLFLLLFIPGAWAQLLPVKQEPLGAWNYLYPLESRSGRSVSTPTVLGFGTAGERVAMLLPGSVKLAEFKDGIFHDLQLPEEWAPLSLAVNRDGKLFCLVQHAEKFLHLPDEWKKRWIIGLESEGWEAPAAIPYEKCDRLEFDSQGRLWALGANPHVGFLEKGKWTTFTYSNDRKLQFLPLRLTEDTSGRVLLFAYEERPGETREISRLVGTLIFAGSQFIRDSGASTAAARDAESRRYAEPIGQPGFDRAHGYVCRAAARNSDYRGPKTALRAGKYFFVSLGNQGLLWADTAELAATPPLAADEWETFDDITVPPASDPAGNLWVGRGSHLLKIGVAGTETAAGELSPNRDSNIDFDALGRPWVMAWHGSSEGTVTICERGVLRSFPDLPAALRREAAAFEPGRILPFALKTSSGLVAVGGAYFDSFTIIDARGPHPFTPLQISRGKTPPDMGHGYNPFRNGEPWIDAAGHVYTRVDGSIYVYDPAHRSWSSLKDGTEAISTLPPPPAEPGNFRDLESADHHHIVFQGFHFFAVAATGEERQLDTGENPLAFYPFWSGWYSSPGQTRPCVDPTGRVWVCPLGPYAQYRQWSVLRKPAW